MQSSAAIAKECHFFIFSASVDRCHLARRFGSPHWIPFYTFVLRLYVKSQLVSLAQSHAATSTNNYNMDFRQHSLAFCRQEVELWEKIFGTRH
jgi:hypothetical protein